MTNIDLYKQPGYEDHMVKTIPVSFDGQLCIEVSSVNLLSTSGYSINHRSELTSEYDSTPLLRLCDKTSDKSGTDLRLFSLKNRMFEAASGEEFALPMAVINSGSDTAMNVTVNYKIPYAEEIRFVRDDSGIFTCSATTTPSKDEGLVMNVSCQADKLPVGLRALPLVFLTTKEAAIYNGLFEFYISVSSSSPETDTTNNTADSYVLVY